MLGSWGGSKSAGGPKGKVTGEWEDGMLLDRNRRNNKWVIAAEMESDIYSNNALWNPNGKRDTE